jgi:hypothetical protein
VELGASISVGVDDRCVRSIASDVFQARLHAAETFQVRQPSFLLWQHANQRRDGGCATIVEIALMQRSLTSVTLRLRFENGCPVVRLSTAKRQGSPTVRRSRS